MKVREQLLASREERIPVRGDVPETVFLRWGSTNGFASFLNDQADTSSNLLKGVILIGPGRHRPPIHR